MQDWLFGFHGILASIIARLLNAPSRGSSSFTVRASICLHTTPVHNCIHLSCDRGALHSQPLHCLLTEATAVAAAVYLRSSS
jgi:hypothetical protein